MQSKSRFPGKLRPQSLMQPHSENSRPTLQDVAVALGMAKSTVSQGLSGTGTISAATRERILKVAREMGYEPNPVAQRLANKGNNNLVYLCSCDLDVGIGTGKILSIQWKLKRRRRSLEVPLYSVTWGDEHDQQTQAEEVRDLCRQQPRAIVYATQGGHPSVLPELQRYQEKGGILVCYDAPLPLTCDQVVFDREHNAYQAARHLIERGHRKLGINLSPPSSGGEGAQQSQSRLSGFCRALEEAGLDINPQWFFEPGGYEKGGQEMAARFLAMKERPTGLCIVNDYTALAFMSDVMAVGIKIPEEVSVVGLDNQLVASYCPVPLTSSVHPVEEIVGAVVDLLIDRLDGNRDEPRLLTIRGEMVERQSVAAFGG